MNGAHGLTAYEAVSGLSVQMLAAARAGDWDGLATLASRGAASIRMAGAGAAPLAAGSECRASKVALIHELMARDREIRALTEPWTESLAALLHGGAAPRTAGRRAER